MAAQPTEEDQHQEADLGNESKVELVQDPKVETQEQNLVEPEAQEAPKDDTPELIPGVRISQRVRTQTKQPYVPSMSGTKYETIMDQLEQHGTLHPDTQMFFNQELEEKPTMVSVIMTQL